MLAHRGLRLVIVASLVLAFTGYPAFDSGLPAYSTVEAHVSAHVVALSLTVNTAFIVATQLIVLRVIRRVRRSSALAATGLILAASWAVFGPAGLPIATGLIAAGAAAVWIGLLCLCCLGTVAIAAVLRRTLTAGRTACPPRPTSWKSSARSGSTITTRSSGPGMPYTSPRPHPTSCATRRSSSWWFRRRHHATTELIWIVLDDVPMGRRRAPNLPRL